MIINCPSCKTKFSVSPSLIEGVSNARFHCSRCDHFFYLNEKNESSIDIANPESDLSNSQSSTDRVEFNDAEPNDQESADNELQTPEQMSLLENEDENNLSETQTVFSDQSQELDFGASFERKSDANLDINKKLGRLVTPTNKNTSDMGLSRFVAEEGLLADEEDEETQYNIEDVPHSEKSGPVTASWPRVGEEFKTYEVKLLRSFENPETPGIGDSVIPKDIPSGAATTNALESTGTISSDLVREKTESTEPFTRRSQPLSSDSFVQSQFGETAIFKQTAGNAVRKLLSAPETGNLEKNLPESLTEPVTKISNDDNTLKPVVTEDSEYKSSENLTFLQSKDLESALNISELRSSSGIKESRKLKNYDMKQSLNGKLSGLNFSKVKQVIPVITYSSLPVLIAGLITFFAINSRLLTPLPVTPLLTNMLRLSPESLPKPPPNTLGLLDLHSRLIALDSGEQLLEISGLVDNADNIPFKDLRIKARIFDTNNNLLDSKIIPAPNGLSGEVTLESLTSTAIHALQSEPAVGANIISANSQAAFRVAFTEVNQKATWFSASVYSVRQ